MNNGQVVLDVISGQREGQAPDPPKIGRAVFACIGCGATLDENYLRSEGVAGRIGLQMVAVVVDAPGGRQYRVPEESERLAALNCAVDSDLYDVRLEGWTRDIRPVLYGFASQGDLYTPRQLLALTTFADLVAATHQQILDDGGTQDWADALATVLGLAVGRLAQYMSSQVRWFIDSRSGGGQALPAFGRNDLPMSWDFVEPSLGSRQGSLTGAVTSISAGLRAAAGLGQVACRDARTVQLPQPGLVATDPPYFDAIGYADLSDYFYMWHRKALRSVHPDLYGTVAAPKSGELTAIPSHHQGSPDRARRYFMAGFTETFRNLQGSMAAGLPMLVIYASKEQKSGQGEETRWESILTAMMDADLEITGAWPLHMTSSNRMVGLGVNAVATYIVLVCRPRPADASTVSLGDFVRSLRRELPSAIKDLQAGSILPVDLYQAALGPGMQIYSRYRKVEDSHGERVPVGRALQLITAAVGEVLDEQEGDLDPASRFAVTWWDQFGWQPGPFGEADKIARQYGTHVDDVVRSEVVTSGAGKVQLLGSEQLDRSWTPQSDAKPTAWEAVHHLADRLIDGGGETEAAALLAQLGGLQDPTRTLAYRLHDIAARRGRAKDQERLNALIGQWTSMVALAATHTPEGLF